MGDNKRSFRSRPFDRLARGMPYRGRHIAARAKRIYGLLFVRVRSVCTADSLTPRELEVAWGVANGQSHKTVARLLGIAPATARTHMQKIHDKLGTNNTAAIVARLMETN